MTIKFYKIHEDPRTVFKTLKDENPGKNLQATLTGSIKTDCSISKPVLEISYDSDVFESNYVYIDGFNRYYFITDIQVSAQRIMVYCDIDVLMTYHTEIWDLVCVVQRQEQKHRSNLYMQDDMFKTLAPKEFVPILFPKSFSDNGSYVLCVGGAS